MKASQAQKPRRAPTSKAARAAFKKERRLAIRAAIERTEKEMTRIGK